MTNREDSDPHRPLEEGQSWNIGGQDQPLPPAQQLEQLLSYLEAHYDAPAFTPPWNGGGGDRWAADNYWAKLPDRITHAALMVLGTGVDHSTPGVAYTAGAEITEVPELAAVQFNGEESTGHFVIAVHAGRWWHGSGAALEMQWHPEVAAVACLSGATVLDVDYPLAPEHSVPEMTTAVNKAIEYARSQGAASVTVWGQGSGAVLAVLCAQEADALVLSFPDFAGWNALPEEVRGGAELPAASHWPDFLVQQEESGGPEVATAAVINGEGHERGEITRYHARDGISTPETARQRVRDIAEFLRRR